jgi:hypothetical protein
MKMSWTGMYIPDVNKALDIDHNGTFDVIYYTTDQGLEDAKAAINWAANEATCATVRVSADPTVPSVQVQAAGSGYYLAWNIQNDNKKVWGNKQYLYPIPILVMTNNPQITQNPGWEHGATNDGN